MHNLVVNCVTFISMVDITMLSLYSGAKEGEIIGIIVENELINGPEKI